MLRCSNNPRWKKRAGFMLIEVLVATTLLAVGVTAALHAVFKSLSASQDAQNYTKALFLAQTAMSKVENRVTFTDDFDVGRHWSQFEDHPLYQWRATVEEDMDFWTRRIAVTVRWAKREQDLFNDEDTFYYRLVTEVPMPRFPEDYQK